ncbi:hypothetical protein MKK51_05610 [Methylobacterium sp. E-045]|nr:hypothetical protein [Methylobacterium sp. E-045]
MTRRAYAEDTKVSVITTRQEIEALLRKTKANRIVIMDEPAEALVMFELAGRLIRMRVEIDEAARDQVRMSIWRALFIILKAKLVAIDRGVSTVEQEFLAHVVLPDGQTVGQWFEPQLQLAFEHGVMPTHPLMIEGPK